MAMSGRYLLDTNIVIALFANEKAVLDGLNASTEVFIPSIAVGELYFGSYRSGKIRQNLLRVDEFVAKNVILSCDAVTASLYGRTKEKLKQKGKPIPENDVWIAAIAIQYNLVLVTRDAHFREVDGLTIEVW